MENVLNQEIGGFTGSREFGNRQEVDHLGEATNDGEYYGVAL